MTKTSASKQLGRRLTLITALVGVGVIAALFGWQLRPRTVEEAIGPKPLGFGDPDATTQIVSFLSPTCPHCARFELGVGKDFYARAEAGEFYYAIYPLMLEDDREPYTLAFFCAYQQAALPVFSLLHYQNYYLNQNRGLIELAEQAGMAPKAFSTCLDAPKTQKAMAQARRWMDALKVPGTPTFFVRTRADEPYLRIRGERDEAFWNNLLNTD